MDYWCEQLDASGRPTELQIQKDFNRVVRKYSIYIFYDLSASIFHPISLHPILSDLPWFIMNDVEFGYFEFFVIVERRLTGKRYGNKTTPHNTVVCCAVRHQFTRTGKEFSYFLCFYTAQTVEQAVELPMIWDPMALTHALLLGSTLRCYTLLWSSIINFRAP